jgi:predicted dehydrogenase
MLNVVVVGVGHLGRHHARILSKLKNVNLIGVVDPNRKQGISVAESAKAPWYSDLELDLISKTDCAVIAVPTSLHLQCAAPLLRASVPCLIEKPMAQTAVECKKILDLAEENNTFVTVGHVERFNPAIRRAMEKGIEARFMEAHRLAAYSFRSTDVGVVLDLMIHDIDLSHAWTNSEVIGVDAVGGSTFSPSEDIASARLHFENGAVANLTASRLSLKPMRRFRVFGPDAYLSIDSHSKYALLAKKSTSFSPELMSEIMKSDSPQTQFERLLDIEELALDDDEPLRVELEEFLLAVSGNPSRVVTGIEGMQAVKVAEEVVSKLEACRW